MDCIEWTKDRSPKNLNLTWKQLEAQNGLPVEGMMLEVRAFLDSSTTCRQMFQSKDDTGVVRTLAAYTNHGKISGLKQGSMLRWNNPRMHRFADRSTGARIEQDDLQNLAVV